MSSELKRLQRHSVVSFWGGDDRGVMVQVTSTEPMRGVPNEEEGFIQLSMLEAAELINVLVAFVKQEAERRRVLLKAEVDKLAQSDRTIFHQVLKIDKDMFDVPKMAVKMVDVLCPKAPPAPVLKQDQESTPSEYVLPFEPCPKCGTPMKEDEDTILTTCPPKVKMDCPQCKHFGYREIMEDECDE